MDTVGADASRQFRRVVHDEGHREIATDRPRVAAAATAVWSSRSFLPQLDDVDATSRTAGRNVARSSRRPRRGRDCASSRIEHEATLEVLARGRKIGHGGAEWGMQIPAKAEYAIRALLTFAASEGR